MPLKDAPQLRVEKIEANVEKLLAAHEQRARREQVLLGISTTIVVLLLGWIGSQTQDTAVGVAELRVEVRQISFNSDRIIRLEERIRELETQLTRR